MSEWKEWIGSRGFQVYQAQRVTFLYRAIGQT